MEYLSLAQDKFGINMLFETNPNGAQPFEMGFGNWKDRIDADSDNYSRWNNGDFDGSGANMVLHDSSKKDARYGIFSVSKENYEDENIETLCRKKLAEKGYMQTDKDWRNIEFTAWAYFEDVSNDGEEWTFYARGGRHSNDNNGCEGSALKACIHYNGDLKFDKETHHGSDNQGDIKGPAELKDGIIGRWLGFKYVLYNKNKDKDPVMEWYIDFLDKDENKVDSKGKPKNQWKLVHTRDDKEGFGDGDECDDCPTKGVQITWGGPIATIRWDDVKKVHLKWASLREIMPLTKSK